MDDPSGATLSGAERAAFQRDGFVLPQLTVGAHHVVAMAAATAVLVRTAGPAAAGRIDDPHRAATGLDGNPFRACAADPSLHELIAPLLGSVGVLWRSVLLHAAEAAAPDGGWRAADAAWVPRPRVALAVRIALDRADRGNGCLRLLPRPHERLVRALRNTRARSGLAVASHEVDDAIVVEAVRDPGALTLYDIATLTCEPANRSGRPRAAVVFHYVPADARTRAAG
ncbi:MAG: phytanoyl-CoA dioxygenase family protein [Proteobacteria bacterium]|nr:phytanoyl-CoA dioxygenase family protein [Pseudomonadota bacterium]